MQNFSHDRSHPYLYNYRAEELFKIPPLKSSPDAAVGLNGKTKVTLESGMLEGYFKRTEELPSSFKLVDAPAWNNRTGVINDSEDRQIRDYKQRKLARQNSQRKLKQLVRSGSYLSPVKRTEELQEEIRRQKREGTFTLDKRILRDPIEEKVELYSTNNRFAIERPRLLRSTRHSGVWELNKSEGRFMWSDTGSFEYDSPGDIVQVRNLDRKNYGALTLSATSLHAPRRITLLERNRMNSSA